MLGLSKVLSLLQIEFEGTQAYHILSSEMEKLVFSSGKKMSPGEVKTLVLEGKGGSGINLTLWFSNLQ